MSDGESSGSQRHKFEVALTGVELSDEQAKQVARELQRVALSVVAQSEIAGEARIRLVTEGKIAGLYLDA